MCSPVPLDSAQGTLGSAIPRKWLLPHCATPGYSLSGEQYRVLHCHYPDNFLRRDPLAQSSPLTVGLRCWSLRTGPEGSLSDKPPTWLRPILSPRNQQELAVAGESLLSFPIGYPLLLPPRIHPWLFHTYKLGADPPRTQEMPGC